MLLESPNVCYLSHGKCVLVAPRKIFCILLSALLKAVVTILFFLTTTADYASNNLLLYSLTSCY